MTPNTPCAASRSVAHPSCRARFPDHVVHQAFAAETVVLNLETGQYHGLQGSAGRMVSALDGAESIAAAAAELTAYYGAPRELIERDLLEFCEALADRGLLEIDGAG